MLQQPKLRIVPHRCLLQAYTQACCLLACLDALRCCRIVVSVSLAELVDPAVTSQRLAGNDVLADSALMEKAATASEASRETKGIR